MFAVIFRRSKPDSNSTRRTEKSKDLLTLSYEGQNMKPSYNRHSHYPNEARLVALKDKNPDTHTHTDRHTHTHTHPPTHPRTHARTHARTYARMRPRTTTPPEDSRNGLLWKFTESTMSPASLAGKGQRSRPPGIKAKRQVRGSQQAMESSEVCRGKCGSHTLGQSL